MAYRRRRTYRSTNRRRGTYVWVRNDATTTGAVGSGYAWIGDALAPLHFGENIMRIPGPSTSLPNLDTSGATVVRVRGYLAWEGTASTPPLPVGSGLYFGLQVGSYQGDNATATSPMATQEPYEAIDPVNSANISDWLYWEKVSTFDTYLASLDVTIGAHRFDVRSKRVLRELNHTLGFVVMPASAGGVMSITGLSITTSTLLKLHR